LEKSASAAGAACGAVCASETIVEELELLVTLSGRIVME
jgi:hypothetical protein